MTLGLGSLELHDVTLIDVLVDWSDGVVAFGLRMPTGKPGRLIAVSATRVEIGREFLWGPSVSINGASLAPGTTGRGSRLVIEMQSGDEIVVEASSFTLEVT